VNIAPKKIWIAILAIIALSLVTTAIAYAWQSRSGASKTIQIYEAYDCDKLRIKTVEITDGKSSVDTALSYLPGPGGISTVAEYSKSFRIEDTVAHIDWPVEMAGLSNIDTSCALYAFLQPIEKTLTNIYPIKTVIHSMGGSVNAFYERMGLSCPTESAECDYDDVAIAIDNDFIITNVGNANGNGSITTSIIPIFAYQCDIYEVRNNVPLRYSKIDFFISKDEINASSVLIGTTPGGSAGSGECDLLENESILKLQPEPGRYKIWAVRYIDSKPDKRTPDFHITLNNASVKIPPACPGNCISNVADCVGAGMGILQNGLCSGANPICCEIEKPMCGGTCIANESDCTGKTKKIVQDTGCAGANPVCCLSEQQ